MRPQGPLGRGRSCWHAGGVDEEQGIYRGEVLAIMGALADIGVDTRQILDILTGYDEGEDEEEEMDS